MSQSRELLQHIDQMGEIRSILNSMKNLAFIETHKLLRFQSAQNKVVEAIENTARDFLDFYPYAQAADDDKPPIVILIGAERGFCGDFNQSLLDELERVAHSGAIAIGSRLINRWPESYPKPLAALEGANVAEEVPAIVNRLLGAITSQQEMRDLFNLSVVYHDTEPNGIAHQSLLPPFQQLTKDNSGFAFPPLLNLEPAVFFAEMVEHYLFAVLHKLCYTSLMAENQRRLQHLEGAVRHLDDETVKLRRKSQSYRQEEITEELEVILLNADNS